MRLAPFDVRYRGYGKDKMQQLLAQTQTLKARWVQKSPLCAPQLLKIKPFAAGDH